MYQTFVSSTTSQVVFNNMKSGVLSTGEDVIINSGVVANSGVVQAAVVGTKVLFGYI